jgi:hypothetical protein
MIFDHRGRALEKRKQYGYIVTPAEFEPVDTRPKGALVDVIGSERVELEEDEEE